MPVTLTREQVEEKLSRAFPPAQSASLVEVLDDIRQAELQRAADTRELRQALTALTGEVRKLAEAQVRTEARLEALAEAQARTDGTAVYLLAEVSQTVRLYDVRGAADRGRLLSQATRAPVLSVVAGRRIREAAEQAARQAGVWRVMDRRMYGPDQPVAREQVAEEEVG